MYLFSVIFSLSEIKYKGCATLMSRGDYEKNTFFLPESFIEYKETDVIVMQIQIAKMKKGAEREKTGYRRQYVFRSI